MNIDNINDIETLRDLLKTQMVQLKEDTATPTIMLVRNRGVL